MAAANSTGTLEASPRRPTKVNAASLHRNRAAGDRAEDRRRNDGVRVIRQREQHERRAIGRRNRHFIGDRLGHFASRQLAGDRQAQAKQRLVGRTKLLDQKRNTAGLAGQDRAARGFQNALLREPARVPHFVVKLGRFIGLAVRQQAFGDRARNLPPRSVARRRPPKSKLASVQLVASAEPMRPSASAAADATSPSASFNRLDNTSTAFTSRRTPIELIVPINRRPLSEVEAVRSAASASGPGITSSGIRADEANRSSANSGAKWGTAAALPNTASCLQAIALAGGAPLLSVSISSRSFACTAVGSFGTCATASAQNESKCQQHPGRSQYALHRTPFAKSLVRSHRQVITAATARGAPRIATDSPVRR